MEPGNRDHKTNTLLAYWLAGGEGCAVRCLLAVSARMPKAYRIKARHHDGSCVFPLDHLAAVIKLQVYS